MAQSANVGPAGLFQSGESRRGGFRIRDVQSAGLVVVLLLLVVLFSILSRNFLTVSNWTNVLRQVSFLMLLCCGQTLVILTGGIDLSVGSMMGLVSVATAAALLHLNPALAIIVGLRSAPLWVF